MPDRRLFVRRLRDLGYAYKSTAKSLRNDLYRKTGGTHCVYVPRVDILKDEYVRSTLSQCGVSKADVEIFIKNSR